MTPKSNSQDKRQSRARTDGLSAQPSKKAGARAAQTSNTSDSSALTSLVNNVMATVSADQAMRGTLDNFAKAVDALTMGDASNTVAQVFETIEQATVTVAHAKETVDLGKKAFESVRGTTKNIVAHIKENPEPFIAAAVPAMLGLFLMFKRSQVAQGVSSRKKPVYGRAATVR